ncbi:MAG: thioredoxin-dependent thiol peroxidase [Alphaproteobacteria bacterium]
MPDLKPGDAAPDFCMPTDGNGTVRLIDFKGRKLVLYFYPKDDTPGCTMESCDFRDQLPDFNRLGIDIIGISKDSVARHDKFKKKYDLNFPLASDEKGDVCERYGVWKEKSMMGKKYMGIERSTFLIDETGKIARLWRSVKVTGHADEVKAAAQTL